MTVETTTFLTTGKMVNGHEKSAKFLKNHKNLIIFLLAFVLLLFCISASVLQMWIFNRMNGMQHEIDTLKTNLLEIKNEMDEGKLLNEINEFSKEYTNQNDIKEQIDLDRVNINDEKNKFDDVGDDEDEEDDDGMSLLDDNDEYHSGDYDDDGYDLDSDSLEDDDLPEAEKTDDDNNIYKDMTKHTRKTRSITGVTQQGVPIVEEPYQPRRNRTKPAYYDPSREKDPRLKLNWNGGYHRNGLRKDINQNDRYRHHNTRHHHNSNRFAFAAAPVYHAYPYPGYGNKPNETSEPAPITLQNRQSRVMHLEDKTKAFRHVVSKSQLAKLQEQKRAPEHFVQNMSARRKGYPHSVPMRRNLELKNGRRMKITAVHFDGDSRKVADQQPHSFKGNGRVELHGNMYLHWKPAHWVSSHGMTKFFQMDPSGTLTVNDHGVFLIYAQVFYSDAHDMNGFVIEHNDRTQYQCTTMTHTSQNHDIKTNSCYTSGLIHLQKNDKIRLRDAGHHRVVLLEPAKSYFGLIKINLMPSSTESTEIENFRGVK